MSEEMWMKSSDSERSEVGCADYRKVIYHNIYSYIILYYISYDYLANARGSS